MLNPPLSNVSGNRTLGINLRTNTGRSAAVRQLRLQVTHSYPLPPLPSGSAGVPPALFSSMRARRPALRRAVQDLRNPQFDRTVAPFTPEFIPRRWAARRPPHAILQCWCALAAPQALRVS